MESLISRWNREKAEALERARVFDVEERDGCLILTKRLSPFLPQAQSGIFVALVWMFINWQVFHSPVNRGTWMGWVILWMLVGPALAFFPLRQAWKIRRGEVWGFNRDRRQLEHNGEIVLSFDQFKSVRAVPARGDRSATLLLDYRNSKTLLLDDMGRHEEHLRVGQQIADFLGVRFNPPYW